MPTAVSENVFSGLLWLGALLLLVVLAFDVVLWIRSRLWTGEDRRQGMFTLDELRRHRDQGRLSVQEFDALKMAILRPASANSSELRRNAADIEYVSKVSRSS